MIKESSETANIVQQKGAGLPKATGSYQGPGVRPEEEQPHAPSTPSSCPRSTALICAPFSHRLTPYEWYSPHPCAQGRCSLLVNQYSLGNSLWFPVGGFMQQGSTIAPRALSTRCVSGVW